MNVNHHINRKEENIRKIIIANSYRYTVLRALNILTHLISINATKALD